MNLETPSSRPDTNIAPRPHAVVVTATRLFTTWQAIEARVLPAR